MGGAGALSQASACLESSLRGAASPAAFALSWVTGHAPTTSGLCQFNQNALFALSNDKILQKKDSEQCPFRDPLVCGEKNPHWLVPTSERFLRKSTVILYSSSWEFSMA